MKLFRMSALCALGLIFGVCFWHCNNTQASGEYQDGLLATGALQAAGSSEEQDQLLELLGVGRQQLEKSEPQVDISMLVVTRQSQELCDALSAQAGANDTNAKGLKLTSDQTKVLGPTTTRARWAYKGDKVRYDLCTVDVAGAKVDNDKDSVQSSFDGSVSRIYWPVQGVAHIVRDKETPIVDEVLPSWLTLTTSEGKQISSLLVADGAVYEGRQTVGDDECLKVSLPSGRGRLEIWISPSHGYRAKRISYSLIHAGEVGAYSVAEVDSFKQYGDSWFPDTGTYVRYTVDESGGKRWSKTMNWSVASLNSSAADDAFTVAFPIGTEVSDFVHKTTSTVGTVDEGTSSVP